MTPATKTDETPSVASRPRVAGEREAQILDATLDVLCEVGYDRLTMDAVANASKASKATLYRRWSTKGDLVVDALVRAKGAPCVVNSDTGSLRDDLIESTCHDTGLSDAMTMSLFAGLVSAIQHDADFAAAFHERFLRPKVEQTMVLFERARDRGEIAEGVDADLISSVLPAVALHRTFILGIPTDDSMVERIVDEVVMPAVKCAPRDTR
ncbi:TetR/AcrR family transcriptional regulator [Solicola gregarius]|uniref:TetR/AcrR family transcriptional regulator n=1 Tax=Solicola gregarius TaxID=2908642 RepID=A0AA46YJU4_9ACTN|nr:TetR/AcrR family transcriptional regulator [Solicola gregarius]UYM04722.1 TetR/AcrR family transcriptional regulator [Solicola gregarius]